MKKFGKIISIFCALLMVMSLMAACGSDQSEEVQEEAVELEQEVEETEEAVEEKAEEQAEAVQEKAEETVEQNNESAGSEAVEIGEDAALEIALKDAGLAESDVDVTKCKLDYDDGRTEYEVEFRQGTMEYEYTLDAFTGEILERDIDNDDD